MLASEELLLSFFPLRYEKITVCHLINTTFYTFSPHFPVFLSSKLVFRVYAVIDCIIFTEKNQNHLTFASLKEVEFRVMSFGFLTVVSSMLINSVFLCTRIETLIISHLRL